MEYKTYGAYADKYVSKWGLEQEMTKGHIKKGREGGLTPFDLLKTSEGRTSRTAISAVSG